MTTPATHNDDTTAGHQPDSLIGRVVHDHGRGRLGKVMDKVGPRYQLRPLDGGREWETDHDNIEVAVLPRCAVIDRLKAERGKAHKEGRSAEVHMLTTALGRHLREMHP
ncbi:hypothetical protein [Streptomyces sp. NPDC000405]|uniref:hypothetical protein n=1 Tax=Streptomyces sp. NPDC000405 TaxID=3161033 RepID=UPI00398D25C4